MKIGRLIKIIYTVLPVLFFSCTEKTLNDGTLRVEEGLASRVQIGFRAEPRELMTRTEQSEFYENRVDNIYVFIFDGAGEIKYRKLFTSGSGLSYEPGSMSSGTLILETTSMNNAMIIGIANLTTTTTATAYDVIKSDMDNIKDLNDLKNFVMTMHSNSIYRGALFMMTGYAQDMDGNTTVIIPGTESGTSKLDCTLLLKRSDAKIRFNVKAEEQSGWHDFYFEPKEWIVKRIPAQSLLLEQQNSDADNDDCRYFNSNSYSFESQITNTSGTTIGGGFVFYMPENRKTPVTRVEEYAAREEWLGTDAGGNKIFTNANENSTYVEMTGILSYIDESGQLINADLRMIVHLGYAVRKGSGDVPDVNDYNTLRNGDYTYNVTIKGIDDINVDVQYDDMDPRPGYEGDVTIGAKESMFEFDAHYDRRLISFNKSDLDGELKWSVNTPFSRGTYTVNSADEVPYELRDYRWVKFAINRDYQVDDNVYVKYPGDQNYNNPYPMDGAPNDQPSPYYMNTCPDARLLDINQLILRFKDEVEKDKAGAGTGFFDDSGNVAVTVFVDENLYFNHPITGESGENNRSLWKLTTDTEDRQLLVIVSDAAYSQDGNSSVVSAKFSFKQHPIRTVFDATKSELVTAWGLESVMETGRLADNGIGSDTDSRNGRLNTLKCLLGSNYATNPIQLKWTDVLGVNGPYEMKGTQSALRACLMRNRDLDGDNIVDANEIRWYLAAIDQLTDIYIGEYALDPSAYLYPRDADHRENKTRWHYTSSSGTMENNVSCAWIIWAEEGASRGKSVGSIDDNGNTNTQFAYRCVRNLGLSLDNPDEIPADLVVVNVNSPSYGYYTIDLSNMNPKSRRSNKETTQLPAHNELSADNRPYAKFIVHPSYYPAVSQSWQYLQTYNGYPDGFRIPNQRELLIMTTRLPSYAWIFGINYYCQTAFSMKGVPPYTSAREGFYWNSQSGNFILQNNITEKGYVRPVADTD